MINERNFYRIDRRIKNSNASWSQYLHSDRTLTKQEAEKYLETHSISSYFIEGENYEFRLVIEDENGAAI